MTTDFNKGLVILEEYENESVKQVLKRIGIDFLNIDRDTNHLEQPFNAVVNVNGKEMALSGTLHYDMVFAIDGRNGWGVLESYVSDAINFEYEAETYVEEVDDFYSITTARCINYERVY